MGLNIEYARLAYGEQIIRSTHLPPEEVKDFLSLDGDLESARQWLAFAHAEREGDSGAVRGLLVYLCSHGTDSVDRPKRAWLLEQIKQKKLGISDLTIEMLVGTHLNWSHVFELVGKEFNPTREKDRVKSIYESFVNKDRENKGRVNE